MVHHQQRGIVFGNAPVLHRLIHCRWLFFVNGYDDDATAAHLEPASAASDGTARFLDKPKCPAAFYHRSMSPAFTVFGRIFLSLRRYVTLAYSFFRASDSSGSVVIIALQLIRRLIPPHSFRNCQGLSSR